MHYQMARRLSLLTVAVAACLNSPVTGANEDQDCASSHRGSDLWIDTRLETAYLLNPNLSAFSIETHVDNGSVQLLGTVKSDVQRDLAEEIAKSLDGVSDVSNDIAVEEEHPTEKPGDQGRTFAEKVADATTTAQVKLKLIANENIDASNIDVDTVSDVVQLTGSVGSRAQKDLAEYIARNTYGVKSVRNDLTSGKKAESG